MTCELCEKDVELTRHHLIPATCHTNQWFKKNFTREQMAKVLLICRTCHSGIHDVIPSEKELGRQYNSKELLLSHEGIRKMIAWSKKQKR